MPYGSPLISVKAMLSPMSPTSLTHTPGSAVNEQELPPANRSQDDTTVKTEICNIVVAEYTNDCFVCRQIAAENDNNNKCVLLT